MRRRAILVGSLLALVVLAFSIPSIVRWRIRSVLAKRYPDAHVEQIDLHWGYVQLREVSFAREWARGQLDLVTVTWDEKTITLSGGTVVADLDKRHGQSSEGSKKVVAEHLQGTVTRGDITANFTDLQYVNGSANAPEVTVKHPKYGIITVKGASYADNVVSAEEVSLTLPPFGAHDLGNAVLRRATILTLSREVGAGEADFPKLGVSATDIIVGQEIAGYKIHIGGLKVNDPRLASVPVTFANLDLEANPEAKTVNLMRNGAKIASFADLNNRFFVGDAPCSTWLQLLPEELRAPALREVTPGFTGKLSFELDVKPKVSLFFLNTCKTTCDFPVIRALRKSFTYPIRKADGSEDMRTSGPATITWTPLAAVSRHLVTGLTTMEDPGFFGHRGIIRQAIENSIRDDLSAGKFLRGGSTLTMQLAKNLWLTHEKTLGRKAQEAFLTMALESCLSKDEILGLYVNVVEFGPGLYGIGPAARHYFKVAPSDLTPEEAFYLVSILPHPRTAPPPNEATMARVKKLMSRFAAEGRIPDLLGTDGPADAVGWDPAP